MRKYLALCVCAGVLVLSGCANYTSLPAIGSTPVSSNPAVLDLINQAEQSRQFGDYALAESAMERALRIEPRNPYLWLELAKANQLQGKDSQARGFAQRARSYASSDSMRARIDSFIEKLEI